MISARQHAVRMACLDPKLDYLSLACLAAAERGEAAAVVTLLLAGADPNLCDATHRRSVLCWLAFRDLVDIIPLAVRCGAQQDWRDAEGYDYLDLLSVKPDGHGSLSYPSFPVAAPALTH